MNRALEEKLQRGFDLACFLHADQATALAILTRAAEKLQVASAAQNKRLYYHAARTKVWLDDQHLLQRLIYIESEPFERRDEESGKVTVDQLVVRFVKHLVRITMKRNAFHVTLGISRVLHNYSTADTMTIDERIGNTIRDDSYYRSRKAKLMNELRERFAEFLRLERGPRGEERFESMLSAAPYRDLVKKSLEQFTPWSTPCSAAAGVSAMNDERPGHDEAEVARMHAVLHPSCYDRLARSLSLAPPEERLEIPAFSVENADRDRPDDRSHRLGQERIEAIKSHLVEEGRRRKKAAPDSMRVLVDGVERSRLHPVSGSRVRFRLGDDAELIEVVGDDERAPLLFATHLITDRERPVKTSIVLEGGQKFEFVLDGETAQITYRQTGFLKWPSGSIFLRPAFVAIALAVALAPWIVMRKDRIEPANVRVPQQPAQRSVTAPPPAPSQPAPTATDDLDATRDAGAAPVIALADIDALCIQMRGEMWPEVKALIESSLQSHGMPVVWCHDAEVALKVRTEGRTAVTVQLVDATGKVLWPSASQSGRRYDGTAREIAASLAADLRAAIPDRR